MTYAKKTCVGVLCGLCLLSWGALPASAADGSCSVRDARAASLQARRAYVRAASRYREAQRVYRATIAYSEMYGPAVGRWVQLARRSGYRWDEMGILMRVIERESKGDPAIPNSQGSGALGLLQVMPEWADGSKQWYWDQWRLPALWDRTHAPTTLRHTVHMGWSNWGE